ncbi:aldo/keto reductase [Algoriphagus chordae]|uniref:Aryl-alcohol dehydrogenase-like predicted oxidoreductase n=1 Tax=Algoriphagus chordae TaxID=237019 RepID=A0A2W7QKL4_9BACT|nr:aldo/keto reductase [Algoriphagus chordae]PZX48661.1 aryl-alcohol dehydrogenase-like predicted oxidoreductase [Algoriphagus chordae]
MNYRILGKTGWKVSEIGLGTWQVGGGWGTPFKPKIAEEILHAAFDKGVNFVDTADVYDAGLSEAMVGQVVRERSERIYVATKCGRRIQPHIDETYTVDKLRRHVEDSLRNTGLNRLDLIQLHCPPTSVYQRDDVFHLFEKLIAEGKVAAMGVSVEQVDEAKCAMEYEVVSSIQVIFNMFRQKPAEELFTLATAKNIGLIIRVPLASGLLSGKITSESTFSKDDHRHFNREGKAFDKGETFAGVPLEKAFPALDELREVFKGDGALASLALRWILMYDEVSVVIPGASKLAQLEANVNAGQLPAISSEQMAAVKKIYDKHIRAEVHELW